MSNFFARARSGVFSGVLPAVLGALIALTVVVLAGFVTEAEAAPACSALFEQTPPSLKEAKRLIKKIDRDTKDFGKTKAYRRVLEATQLKLSSYGIRSVVVPLKIDGKKRDFLQITRASDENPNGRIISAIDRRFGAVVYIDPKYDARGAYLASRNAIILDAIEAYRWFDDASLVLLHEIRHLYFTEREKSGDLHTYTGWIRTYEGYLLKAPEDFYDDGMSLEELSNFNRDIHVAVSMYEQGSMSKKLILSELDDTIDVAKIVLRNLGDVREDTPKKFVERKVKANGVYATIEIFEKGKSAKMKNALGWYSDGLPEATPETSRKELRRMLLERRAKLMAEAKTLREYAEAKTKEIKKKR